MDYNSLQSPDRAANLVDRKKIGTGHPFYPKQSKKLTILRIFTRFQCNFSQFGILSVHQPGTQVEPFFCRIIGKFSQIF